MKAIFILSTMLVLAASAEEKPTLSPIRFSDCHVHLLDFLQNGQFENQDGKFPGDEWGVTKQGRHATLPVGERGRRIESALRGMDLAGTDHALVCGMPFIKKWGEAEAFLRARYYLDSSSRVKPARDSDLVVASAFMDYRRKHADKPDRLKQLERLHPFICALDTTDLAAVDLAIKRIKEFPGLWEGLGELMSRHDDLTNLTTGDRPRGNHPALKRLCRFAGEVKLPVSIHHNIAPVSRNNREVKEPYYLDELVDLVRYCSKGVKPENRTTFIWCHAGISRRIVVADLPFWIREVLKEFPGQIYIDLSWVVLEDYIYKDLDSWTKLIGEFPNNFMIGSDVVGGTRNMKKDLIRYQKLLGRLPKDVRHKVARDNFANLMRTMAARRNKLKLGQRGIVLQHTYQFPEYAHTGRLSDDTSFTRSRAKQQPKK